MKFSLKSFFVWLLLVIGSTAYGQQVPLFNQYYTQPALIYSSASALQKAPQLSLIYRGQWAGLDGAPQNFVLSYAQPFAKKMGFDINVNSFETGILRQTNVGGGLAYSFKLNKHQFSIGTELGIALHSLNESKLSIESLNDELIQSLLGNNGSSVNLGLSLSYQYKSLVAHMAMPKALSESIKNNAFAELSDNNLSDYIVGLGYSFTIDALHQVIFTPNATWRYQDITGSSLDFMGKLDVKGNFHVAAGYRQDYGATAGLGIKVKPNILFTYNYDFGKSDVPFVSDGFNEIGLHFSFKQKHDSDSVIERKGEAIIERLRKEEIYDRKLISPEDQEIVIEYLSANETGRKKERREKGIEAFDAILKNIENTGLARMQAEANARAAKQKEAALESKRIEEAEREQDRIDREKAEAARLLEEKRLSAESAKDSDELTNNYILVVASYLPNSKWKDQYLNELKNKYPKAGVFRNSERGYDYVYIQTFSNLEAAVKAMLDLKAKNQFLDSWVHILNVSGDK